MFHLEILQQQQQCALLTIEPQMFGKIAVIALALVAAACVGRLRCSRDQTTAIEASTLKKRDGSCVLDTSTKRSTTPRPTPRLPNASTLAASKSYRLPHANDNETNT